MHLHRTLSVVLVFIWSAVGVSCSYGNKGPCTNPVVRKEWRAFSTNEKAEWIRAVNCLSHLPHDPALAPSVDPSISLIPAVNTSSSYYDDLVYIHMDLNTRIHFTGQFLPWHRWYLYVFEQSLKYRCGYNGVSPYWNWSIDAPDFFESSFWKDSDPAALTDKQEEGNATFSVSVIEAALETSAGDYRVSKSRWRYRSDLAGMCPINAPPNCTEGPTWSPNEPLFWMHHGMIDKLWYDWQHRNPANANSFFGGSVQSLESLDAYNQYPNGAPPYLNLNTTMPADGLFPELVIGDVLDTTGGVLCYIYE
ncbi:hypothetical protein BGY98DRAFT_1176911 [Russula aff. rugulosa BPL654]|nr:hypothetical protein BGY98DRAFT_1176911 [Russula aff. rugulosa BPL654]